MTDGVSDDDDNSESKSVDSMANRKRKLNTILGSNKRMHVEQLAKAETDFDSDSNHENNDHATSLNDNDDGASSRMSDFDDGEFGEGFNPFKRIQFFFQMFFFHFHWKVNFFVVLIIIVTSGPDYKFCSLIQISEGIEIFKDFDRQWNDFPISTKKKTVFL